MMTIVSKVCKMFVISINRDFPFQKQHSHNLPKIKFSLILALLKQYFRPEYQVQLLRVFEAGSGLSISLLFELIIRDRY